MQKRIRKLYRNSKHGLARLWRWAKGHAARFRALAVWARGRSGGGWAERAKIYERKADWLAKHNDPDPAPGGPTDTFEGRVFAAWIVPWLEKSRKAGWQGTAISGYRSPQYSEQLCYQMCGAPSCPGRCAGRSSNHCLTQYPGGAVDVDIAHRDQFASIQRKIGSPLKNDLPADPNHFSATGH